MLNDFTSIHQSEIYRFNDVNGHATHMTQSSYSFITELESIAHLENNSSNTVSTVSSSNNSTSSSSNSEQQVERSNLNLSYQEDINIYQRQNRDHNPQPSQAHHPLLLSSNHRQQQHPQQRTHTEGEQANYFTVEQDSNYNSNANKFNSLDKSSTLSPTVATLNAKLGVNTSSSIRSMSVDTTQHNSMIPTAHGSEHQVQYSLPTQKNLPESSPSSMALNFSHDPLQAGLHGGQSTSNVQHHSDEIKTQSSNSFELDSASLMQTAAVGMNMWKSTMGLNHFKHPVISDHNFLPSSDLNTFSSWTHGGNLAGHQPSNMTHHILDSQHLIGYSQHQRSLPLPNQDLVGASIKGHSSAEQASFMLNSINHQASTSQNSSSNHQTNQIDNLNLRSNALDHSTSYNLSMNDNQIYTSSRSEGRSHSNAIKPSFVVPDRSVHMSLTNHHHNQLSYHSAEQASVQPTTSHQVASSSSSSSSKTEWRCSFCSEVFPLRTVYQAHLKTHSQDKGNN